ncbi:mitogen-activated protein kinase kinase kinase 5 isoform X2 [Hevea brasiliensis]|uniref:mitogen-activated protein kinase kinase kinase 5 isoform X2 n=1 Tax=Hevea brasiliensis TaxID=3981 RepID=UPI0025DF7EDD|nr:mitogen-activated protein kinase kinase kinase 5 isoform X2 [Hevea brasiliensis]
MSSFSSLISKRFLIIWIKSRESRSLILLFLFPSLAMRWLQNISFSSSSNPSTSAPSSSSPQPTFSSSSSSSSSAAVGDVTFSPSRKHSHKSYIRAGPLGLRFGGGGGPRLTRQRKLRHLAENEVAIQGASAKPNHESAESVQLLRSPSGSSSTVPSRMSSSVPVPVPLPLPLPLPENSNSGDGDLRLKSPKERDRDGIRERERERSDGAREGFSSSTSPIKSVILGPENRKMVKHLDIRSPREVHPDFIMDNYGENFKANAPTRSAPTSPFSSPVLSPQRLTTAADLLPYYQMIAKGNQVWSAPEMATVDTPGLPPPAFFDYTAFSSDSSPLHSPPSRSPHWNPRSPNGPASLLNAKLSIESSTPGRESNANFEVHPLPLPPGAARPSLSAPISQVIAKAESMPLKSQWQKGKLIGRGTFGSVYVASNRETGALCAMKEVDIFPDDPKSAESIKQLEQEIKILSQLKHPNIVQYYGSEIVEDRFYIYLEYVHPGSINKYVREHCGAITENVVRSFTRHILSGLAYLHSMKTIHRDIKGANLLVDASGVVKLADFGMSKHLTGQAAELSLKGSPYWMAPELMQAVMRNDTSSDLALAVDIWSLGCTIIEMFTGKPPWSDYEGASAMFKVLKDTPPIPETLSPDGKDFLNCCFRRNPADRLSASMLLEHRWLKNLRYLDIPTSTRSFNGLKLMDITHSHIPNTSEVKLDQLPVLLGTQSTKGKVASDSFINSSFSSAKLTKDLIVKLPT